MRNESGCAVQSRERQHLKGIDMQTKATFFRSVLSVGSGEKRPRAVARGLLMGLGTLALSAAAYAACPTNPNQVGKNFDGDNLAGCSLQGFNVTGATFRLANLKRTSFYGATGTGVNTIFNGTSAQKTDMFDANFYGANFLQAQFKFTRLEGANFYGATVAHATFRSSDLRQAVFDGANLFSADLRNTVNSYGIRAIGANFQEVEAKDAVLPQMTAHGSDWRNSFLQNTDLSGGYFQHADFRGATLEGTNFKGTNLDYANLCNTDRSPAPLKNSDTSQIGTQCPI